MVICGGWQPLFSDYYYAKAKKVIAYLKEATLVEMRFIIKEIRCPLSTLFLPKCLSQACLFTRLRLTLKFPNYLY